MKFLRVETVGEVRRWDTYIVPVPDDFDIEADDIARPLHDLIAQGKGMNRGTEYEDYGLPVPPHEFCITEVAPATSQT
ncbi:hypothetical protein [Nocardia sp. alder85J]|uniref:hypothetical protein n=1 Tax=Nocardia sp. alder85J TaxID=2862949 RepID=UPI001CD73BB7|nr:hypothetical protein [Nocardia sp. alder85J]MCX4099120.1 hypothetical protein [Nocardia sp. alder85J]